MSSSPRRHHRDSSLSEIVLTPQTALEDDHIAVNETPAMTDEVSVDLAEHHNALIGEEFTNPNNIIIQPTLATFGEDPFTDDGDDNIEHHRIVATEIVNSIKFSQPETIIQNAIVLLDP